MDKLKMSEIGVVLFLLFGLILVSGVCTDNIIIVLTGFLGILIVCLVALILEFKDLFNNKEQSD